MPKPNLESMLWAHVNLALAIRDIARKNGGRIKIKKLVKIMGGESIRPTVMVGIKRLIKMGSIRITKKDRVVLLCSTAKGSKKHGKSKS